MSLTVIDTSIAIKWFIDEQGSETEQALKLLDQLKINPADFIVPELFFNEMLAVFCRLLESVALVQRYMQVIADLGLQRVGNGKELLHEASSLAKKYSISGYDAVFVATAKLTSSIWLTTDQTAVKRLKGSGLAMLLY